MERRLGKQQGVRHDWSRAGLLEQYLTHLGYPDLLRKSIGLPNLAPKLKPR